MKNISLFILMSALFVSSCTLFSSKKKPSEAEVIRIITPIEKSHPDTIVGVLYPEVSVKNMGINEISDMDIMYKIEICSEHYIADKNTKWEGELAPGEEIKIELDTIKIHNSCLCYFQVRVMKVNGFEVKSKIQSSFFTNIRID